MRATSGWVVLVRKVDSLSTALVNDYLDALPREVPSGKRTLNSFFSTVLTFNIYTDDVMWARALIQNYYSSILYKYRFFVL
jgi:hypothetical protein